MPIPPAIVQYKSHNYHTIQNFLRLGVIPPGETDSSMRSKVQAITDCMQIGNPVPPDSFLYRGTDFLEFGKRSIEGVQTMVGKNYTWKGFVSTSVDAHAAYRFIKGLLLCIVPSDSTMFYDMSSASAEQRRMFKNLANEKEILLNCNTRCHIVRVDPAPQSKLPKQYHIVTVRL